MIVDIRNNLPNFIFYTLRLYRNIALNCDFEEWNVGITLSLSFSIQRNIMIINGANIQNAISSIKGEWLEKKQQLQSFAVTLIFHK